MSIDYQILFSTWFIMAFLLWKWVPRDKLRESLVIFMFKQVQTWLLGLMVVEFYWIEYPVRLFTHATQASFSFEYFLYPGICVLFVLYYPLHKNQCAKFLYYAAYCSAISMVEVVLERYTNLVEYNGWNWYWSWLSLFITFYFSWLFYRWFFRITPHQ